MIGISLTEEKYWLVYDADVTKRHSGFSGMGSQTNFPPLVVPELFIDKDTWIARCEELGIPVDDEFLDED